MLFSSTRNPKILCEFKNAMIDAVAEKQSGIFTPSYIAPMTYEQINTLGHMSYTQILSELTYIFCNGKIQKQTLHELAQNAFKDFNTGFGADIRRNDPYFSMQTLEEGIEIANLTYGPTGCCKDYGYCFAAEIVNYLAKQEGQKRSIIDISCSSSGPSAAWAIRNKDYLKGFILMQNNNNASIKALLSKANAKNFGYATITADINFINDLRYEISSNMSLHDFANMSFINEYNLLCIIGYLPLFFKAYMKCNSKPFCISVASGNMTLGMSAYIAKKMGIPIKKIILATEKNNFFYNIQESKLARKDNNIEIGCSLIHSSLPTNFERLLFYLYGSNQSSVKRTIQEIEINGAYKISDDLLDKFKEDFFVARCDNQFNIRNTIYSFVRKTEHFVEQHFAIAKMATDVAFEEFGLDISSIPMVIINTLDFRRNIDFVNSSLGYNLEYVKYPWSEDDMSRYSPTEIGRDKTEILRYIVSDLEKRD